MQATFRGLVLVREMGLELSLPPKKVGSEQIGVKTARLQAVSRCERDLFRKGGTVKRVTDFLYKKSEQA